MVKNKDVCIRIKESIETINEIEVEKSTSRIFLQIAGWLLTNAGYIFGCALYNHHRRMGE